MCLIAIAGKGTDKYLEKFINAVKTGAINNKDGYGYCSKYANLELINFKKGYKNIDDLLKDVKALNLTKDDELIIHSRTGNKGVISDFNCHPFQLSDKQDEIIELEGVGGLPVMVHNGTLFKYWESKSDFSDTYHFVKQFMCIPEFIQLLKRDKDLFASIFSLNIGYNKLAFMFPDHDIVTLGEFTDDEGYKFSNDCYKSKDIKDIGGKTSHNCSVVHKDKNSSDSIRNNNAFGIPLSHWTIGEVYFELKDGHRNNIPIQVMIDPKTDFYTKDEYYWGVEIDKDVISGKTKFEDLRYKRCHMIYKSQLSLSIPILPLDKFKVKYTDYATLLLEDYTVSKNQMRKLLKAYENSKSEDTKITVKGIKGKVDKSAVILYLKVYNNVLKSDKVRNILIPINSTTTVKIPEKAESVIPISEEIPYTNADILTD